VGELKKVNELAIHTERCTYAREYTYFLVQEKGEKEGESAHARERERHTEKEKDNERLSKRETGGEKRD